MLVTALLILVGLCVPTARLMEKSGSAPNPGEFIYKFVIFLLPSVALIMAAVLINQGFSFLARRKNAAGNAHIVSPAARDTSWSLALVCFILSGLLILKPLYNLYWLMVWDSTDNGFEYYWIVLPVLVSILSGAILTINLRTRTAWAGLVYLLLVPGLIIDVSVRAQEVDISRLTETHAGQVSQLIEAYYAREGRYPQDLRQAKPWYDPSLPEPVIMYGQDWCYEAGEEYYRLGCVYREHWSSPELIRRVHKTAGELPDPDSICAEEIEALIQREPFFYEK